MPPKQEIAALASWHRIAVARRGRTTAVLSGLSPAQAATYLFDFMNNSDVPLYRADVSRSLSLRLACEDLNTNSISSYQ